MDFDLSKENIQPLRRGRNAQQLEIAIQAQSNPEYQVQLALQKEHFEMLIRTYQGDDPLETYYNYIMWLEQAYPKNGHEGNSDALLERCLQQFEDDPRYRNDLRFCKLWIKYIDKFPNPVELYMMMKSKNLCTGWADFYKAWAYYYEAAGDFAKANSVFQEGKKNLAQPYEELEIAHKNLFVAAGEHVVYGPNKLRLNERRTALTSLTPYEPDKTHSIQLPTSNRSLFVYEDQATSLSLDGAAPRSIITAAKRQEAPKENTIKPGPWTTVPQKKQLLASFKSNAFAILEDEQDVPVGCLPPNVPNSCLENYSDYHCPLFNHPDPDRPDVVFGYPKHRVYAEYPNKEYSIEELRALRYQRRKIEPLNLFVDHSEEVIVIQDPPILQQQQEPSAVLDPVAFGSPWKSTMEHQNFLQDVFSKSNEHRISALPPKFVIAEDSPCRQDVQQKNPFLLTFSPQDNQSLQQAPRCDAFNIFEQSDQEFPPLAPPKGNAMKTAFRTLNADEVETGSRGGMDVATAAQPADGARPMTVAPFSDSSSSSCHDDMDDGAVGFDESCLDTQQFHFNLNVMKVSTPQNKGQATAVVKEEEKLMNTKKALFSENNKGLSTIFEEKSGYTSSSLSSGGTATKSSVYGFNQNKISTISEEHNSYLEQNMKANEALRRSLLGNLMEDVLSPAASIQTQPRKREQLERVTPLHYIPSDPFNPQLIESLLDRVSFPGVHAQDYVEIKGNPRLVKKEIVNIGRDSYFVDNMLGRGQFGTIYKATDMDKSCVVALKHQKPPNKWEYYICKEIKARLRGHPLSDRFMEVSVGYFSKQASVLVSQFEQLGSLLDAINILKKNVMKNTENLALYFTLQMLQIVKAMHEVQIIHGDIKPDNFLVVHLSNNTLSLKLIDFGRSIDMALFPTGANFTCPITTEDFICCEVRDGRPWSYHTDIFCVAASAHVLLLHDYMQTRKDKTGLWTIAMRLPRYAKADLWADFFAACLNQQSGPANLDQLEARFETELKTQQRHNSLQLQLNSIINMLRKR
ncbi:hypothetical protein ABEB36_011572 [Hypothenemus hampei]|uniref:Mitotic checkpoint serine/threonine-protein kinase BUB1 n=1 Tax=Hypothenemus hampei TaxID=57062 RepID=A0ABD1E8J9_HYPHA